MVCARLIMQINRLFWHATTSGGYCDNPNDLVYAEGFKMESLLHRLHKEGVTAKVYVPTLSFPAPCPSVCLLFPLHSTGRSLLLLPAFELPSACSLIYPHEHCAHAAGTP